jgi:hypothetical protein
VCAGEKAAEWHDVIDAVFLQRLEPKLQGGPKDCLITTWHEDEAPREVAFFFVFNTGDADTTCDLFLVLHVGDSENRQRLDTAVREYASRTEPD